jgi:hypothetical protein
VIAKQQARVSFRWTTQSETTGDGRVWSQNDNDCVGLKGFCWISDSWELHFLWGRFLEPPVKRFPQNWLYDMAERKAVDFFIVWLMALASSCNKWE